MPLPIVPPPIPLGADLLSLTVSGVRRSINKRTGQSFFGIPRKTPTYEQLRNKERAMLKGLGETAFPLESDSNWRIGGPGKPEKIKPNQRIDRGLIIKDLVTLEQISIQFVPQELDYTPDSNFIPIASMGRNNPLYHYTGSEDTLKFTLDWYANIESREDVITNCKKLEALTKNDSFDKPPHPIKLIWNDKLFSKSTWLVVSAPYKLSLFQAHRNMLPQQAYQEITLKRLTEFNSSLNQIRDINS
jgi:hypothetical protein